MHTSLIEGSRLLARQFLSLAQRQHTLEFWKYGLIGHEVCSHQRERDPLRPLGQQGQRRITDALLPDVRELKAGGGRSPHRQQRTTGEVLDNVWPL